MITYSFLTDFLILIFGIIIMVVLRSIRYSNKKININVQYTSVSTKTTNQLIVPKIIFPFSSSELFELNDISYKQSFMILVNNDTVNIFGQYLSLENNQMRKSVISNINYYLSIIQKNNNKFILRNKTDIFLSYVEDVPYIFLEDKRLLLSKSSNFDETGSLLLWTLIFEEPKFITIGV